MQNGQSVVYTSRTMTNAEQAYTQIEKETPAILFAMEHFDQFTYGRHTVMQSVYQDGGSQHRHY